MFIDYTYQDWLAAEDRSALIIDAIHRYRSSAEFRRALEANVYYLGENTTVRRKTILRAHKIETRDENGRRRVRTAAKDVVGNRIASGFLGRLVSQQNHFLLGNGCTVDGHSAASLLGRDFDAILEQLGKHAILQGVSYGFWNVDHLELIEAAVDPDSGFFSLLDEMTGEMHVGIQFWRLAPGRAMYVRVFEEDGVTTLRREDNRLVIVTDKTPYLIRFRRDALGIQVVSADHYGSLPIIPLFGNAERTSALTTAIRSKIDAYDNILSDLADNLDRANDVYWVLNNFGGTTDDVAELLEQINRIKAVANISDGTGAASTAEPHTIQVPYEARCAALSLLEKALYADFMGLNTSELTGGSLTNVAIQAATANLNLKADQYEWQVFLFMQKLLRLLGRDTDAIRFKRAAIGNYSETVADIAKMRSDIDQRTALTLNPYLQVEEVERLCQ